MWFGKIIAGIFGFIIGGPFTALLGVLIGHFFDIGLAKTFSMGGVTQRSEEAHDILFDVVFVVMGRLAKADGRVCEDEILIAENVIQQMQLDSDKRQLAIKLFKQGADPSFDYVQVLERFVALTPRHSLLREMVMTLLIGVALSDGEYHPNEKQILLDVAERLGFSVQQFEHLFSMVFAQTQFSKDRSSTKSPKDHLHEAYEALGVSENASSQEIKKAYRKLMSQHHPDKLIAQGLPEEMIKLATEKSQQIQSAYELLKKSKSF